MLENNIPFHFSLVEFQGFANCTRFNEYACERLVNVVVFWAR
jgi:hypothetical protein